jgi:hypothetical protein
MKSGDATSAMKGATGWLRAASVLTLLLAAGHTLGMPWTPDRTERGAALVAALRAHTFEVMRSTRSYWDFYQGFGITIGVALLALAILLWQIGGVARHDARLVRPLVATVLVTFAAFAVLDVVYFFAVPLALALLCAALVAVAWWGCGAASRECDRRAPAAAG